MQGSQLTTYKFIFSAQISKFYMKAKISSPIFISWKRSQQTAKSEQYDMVDGQTDFSIRNQVLNLPVNMYYDHNAESFQQKKSVFNFTMVTPKGEKVAGVVYVDLAKMLNNKIEVLEDSFTLEKCPVKQSSVQMKITSACQGQRSGDTSSQISYVDPNTSNIDMLNPSMIQSRIQEEPRSKSKIESDPKSSEEIKNLKEKVALLTKINKRLQNELEDAKKLSDGDNLKQELLKSKNIQNKLEQEITELRKQNLEHEKELQKVRAKLEHAYENIFSSLSQHFI